MLQAGPVVVIVPVWNGIHDLPSCLAALERQQGVAFDTIVVDNGSADGSAGYVADQYPAVDLIRNDTDLGFAAGCNSAMHYAKDHAILVLLNQDTVVQPDWLVNLTAPMWHDTAIGITGSKCLYPDGTIQHAGGRVDNRGVGRHIGHAEVDRGQYNLTSDQEFVTGAALAITRSAFQTIGDLDEGFSPAYYEDVDWCLRVRRSGFRVVFVPDSVLIHKEGGASQNRSRDSSFVIERNRLRFVCKHWPSSRLTQEFVGCERDWLNSLGWRGEHIVALMQSVYLYHLLHLSELVTSRAQIMENANGDVDALATALLALRAVYPLRPANLDNMAVRDGFPLSEDASPATYRGFGSELMAQLRRRWPQVSAARITWPIAKQLARATNQQRLADVLLEYLRENGLEIAQLAREVDELRNQLRTLQRHAPNSEE